MSDLLLGVLGAGGVLLGIVGVLVPVLPGLVVVWLATVGTLLALGTSGPVWAVVVLLTVLAAGGTVASTVLPARRAAADGAPARSLGLAAAGAVVGFVVIPVLGLLVGGVLGLLLAERQRLGDWSPAWTSSRRVLASYGIGVLLEVAAGLVMGGLWLVTFVLRA